jgi:CheY-like chemotaxis protein
MKTVLLVEDNLADVLLVQRIFRKLQLEARLEVVNDGADAIDYLSGTGKFADRAQHPVPDVVLLDLKLPRKSGLEVLQWIRNSRFRLLPAVILTSSKLESDILAAYERGCNSYLVKTPDQEAFGEMASTFHRYWLNFNQSVAAS